MNAENAPFQHYKDDTMKNELSQPNHDYIDYNDAETTSTYVDIANKYIDSSAGEESETTFQNNEYDESTDQHDTKPITARKVLAVQKPKKRHSNSKNGCRNCKQRKQKCDENLPICNFCQKKNLPCSYLTMTPFQIHRIKESHAINSRKNYTNEKKYIKDNCISQTNSNVKFNNHEDVNSRGWSFDSDNTNLQNSSRVETSREYHYLPSREVNLNNVTSSDNNTIYQMHEMEYVLLSDSMNNIKSSENMVATNPNNFTNYNYIPLSTNKETNDSQYVPYMKHNMNHIPLSGNARLSTRTFTLDHEQIILALEKQQNKSSKILTLLTTEQYTSLNKLALENDLYLYSLLTMDLYVNLNTGIIFDTLLRKASLLFAMDYYKNAILKQSMLSKVQYQIKINIACSCENNSIISIDEIAEIIKSEYLPLYNSFENYQIYYLMGSFYLLNACLSYHFKNGQKYELSYDESKNAVHLCGLFLTGLYSVLLYRSDKKTLMSSTNIYANYLSESFKFLLVKNYDFELFDEFQKVIDSISPRYTNNVDFENLKLFWDQYTKLSTVNKNIDSVLGVNNTYMIRIINSFSSILPFTYSNLNLENIENFKGRELDIIILLGYLASAQVIASCIPGFRAMIGNSFAGLGIKLCSIKSMLSCFKYIETNELKLIGIYFIRIISFMRTNEDRAMSLLSAYPIGKMVQDDSPDISIHDCYLNVKKLRECDIASEIQIKTFLLHKGQFIRNWNYHNSSKLKPKRGTRVSENKIMNYFKNNDELIDDFVKNNNGFFSLDDDGKLYPFSGQDFKETTLITEFQIKIIWKLSTYIRINNL